MTRAARDDIIARTQEFWSRRAGKDISEEDAREIIANTVGFFGVLREWAAKEKSETTGTQVASTRDPEASAA